jgi:phage gpG-like protein
LISVEVKSAEALAALQKVAGSVKNRAPANQKLAAQLNSLWFRGFHNQSTPEGKPWQPLKLGGRWHGKGKDRRFDPTAKILQDTGNLRDKAMHTAYDNDQVSIFVQAGVGFDYAEVHENGTSRVPQRKMLPEERTAIDYAQRIYDAYIATSIKGAGL